MKYYYENLLANQNVTAKTNIAWVADITTLKLIKDLRLMNGDLNNTCRICDIPYNIKSHSFHINMISNLL